MQRLNLPALFLLPLLWMGTVLPLFAATHRGPASFWYPEIAPNGPVVLVISLGEQRLYAYRNGVAIGVSQISSGKPGYETPPGVYTILQKQRIHYSNLYDDAPMPYMQRLTWSGVAIHAGVVPPRPASHGCIRLPARFARELYGATKPGGVVVVTDQRVAPAELRHPGAVAPVDLQGLPAGLDAQPDSAWLDKDVTPVALSVVISLRDRAAYVLADGRLIGRAPLDVSAASPVPTGTVLYVMQSPASPAPHGSAPSAAGAHVWAAYRIHGDGPVPEPSQLAADLALPADFGSRLASMLVPGTTVLVTDLSGAGGHGNTPMQALMESDVHKRKAGAR